MEFLFPGAIVKLKPQYRTFYRDEDQEGLGILVKIQYDHERFFRHSLFKETEVIRDTDHVWRVEWAGGFDSLVRLEHLELAEPSEFLGQYLRTKEYDTLVFKEDLDTIFHHMKEMTELVQVDAEGLVIQSATLRNFIDERMVVDATDRVKELKQKRDEYFSKIEDFWLRL